MLRHRKTNMLGSPFLRAAWNDRGMTVLQGPKESTDPPILSDFDERKIYIWQSEKIYGTHRF